MTIPLIHDLLLAATPGVSPIKIVATGITPSTTASLGLEITKVIKLLMQLIGFLSVVFVVVGGLQITLSAGNPAHFKQGRETIIYAMVGVGIAVSGYAIVAFIAGKIGT